VLKLNIDKNPAGSVEPPDFYGLKGPQRLKKLDLNEFFFYIITYYTQ